MYQRIDEDISVVGVYQKTSRLKFVPKKFQWRNRSYVVGEVTLANDVRDGGVRKRVYSVVAEGNVYRLCFNRESELWKLEEVWYEG